MEVKKRSCVTLNVLTSRYGLTNNLIKRFFPKPELRKNPYYRHAAPQKVWPREVVEEILQDPELQAELAKMKARRAREQAKADSIREYLLSFDIENLRQKAQQLDRRFVLHIGPTNSGKTHDALEVLKKADSGLYLGPLRLLALEMFDRLNADDCPCNLLTGEEYIETEGAMHTASTIELCDFDSRYEVAVIDEAQMMTDPFRGDRWVKALYCVDAALVEVCLAPEAENLVTEIISGFGASYEIVRHERLAPLYYKGVFKSIKDAEPGDALIVFSRRAVLAVSAELDHRGIPSSVIYGALPPASRREEVRRFSAGETQVVVATDAIGMGISLPIKRIVFCETRKYDGKHTRKLLSPEIKQIAGRAGRFGIYDEGEVLTMYDGKLVESALAQPEHQEERLTLPFPGEAVHSEFKLDELMEAWNSLPNEPGFVRANMSEAIELYKELKPIVKKTDRAVLYQLITCPLDTKDDAIVGYWRECCFAIYANHVLPEPFAGTATLEECERRYKMLDVRHQLLRRIGIEEDRMQEKLMLCELINNFLKEDKDKYLKHCSRCGRILPATSEYSLCEKCFRRMWG